MRCPPLSNVRAPADATVLAALQLNGAALMGCADLDDFQTCVRALAGKGALEEEAFMAAALALPLAQDALLRCEQDVRAVLSVRCVQ
jgi:hypothetical protein